MAAIYVVFVLVAIALVEALFNAEACAGKFRATISIMNSTARSNANVVVVVGAAVDHTGECVTVTECVPKQLN